MSDETLYAFCKNTDAVHQHKLMYSHNCGGIREHLFIECDWCGQAWMWGVDPRYFPCTEWSPDNCDHLWAAYFWRYGAGGDVLDQYDAIVGAGCTNACDSEVEFEQLRQPFIALQPGR
jgi:hypothetical protein